MAYIVPDPEQTLTTEELRCILKQNLPDYMVPSAFVFLDILPLGRVFLPRCILKIGALRQGVWMNPWRLKYRTVPEVKTATSPPQTPEQVSPITTTDRLSMASYGY